MDSRLSLVLPPVEGLADAATPSTAELVGERSLLTGPSLGLLCSSRLPGAILLKTYEFMHRTKLRPVTMVGGFHSPMERTCLGILLRGVTRIILVPARGLGRMRTPVEWRPALDARRMAIISPFEAEVRRSTRRMAEERNRFVLRLSKKLLIPFASRGGMTERLVTDALEAGMPVLTFSFPETVWLRERGAQPIEGLDENHYLLMEEQPPGRNT
jgi:hypothetical protein